MPHLRLELFLKPTDKAEDSELKALAARQLGLKPKAVLALRVVKRALDARRGKPSWQLTVDVQTSEAPTRVRRNAALRSVPPAPTGLPDRRVPKGAPPVIVVGAGPAGLFAALRLAEMGAQVILLERGQPVEKRAMDARRLRNQGLLDPESNLCFGEGGAGAFSDGKLTCRRNDPLTPILLNILVEAGAPERILVDAKPHIGSNRLFVTLKGLRARLLDLGVTLHFGARVDALLRSEGRISGLRVNRLGVIEAPRVLLATGHSARDSFETWLAQGLPIEAKAFALGVRIEHPQPLIDRAQYHLKSGPRPACLPAAEYRLATQIEDRGVYSFCMCPGGVVVPTPTEAGLLAVNGMSYANRGSPYASSGLVAQVELADLSRLGFEGPLAGLQFQRQVEKAAYNAGGGGFVAPAARASDFQKNRASRDLPESRYRPGLVPADLGEVLPGFVKQAIQVALPRFASQIRGYDSELACLIATESRTSSPIRIPRDKTGREVPGWPGLFVAGEGPGYAGGIMSAALDGYRSGQAILESMLA